MVINLMNFLISFQERRLLKASPVAVKKALKNETEIAGARCAHVHVISSNKYNLINQGFPNCAPHEGSKCDLEKYY